MNAKELITLIKKTKSDNLRVRVQPHDNFSLWIQPVKSQLIREIEFVESTEGFLPDTQYNVFEGEGIVVIG